MLDPAQLQRIEEKLDLLAQSNATIVERVGNVRDAAQAKNLADAMTHKELDGRINTLEHWKTSWVAKVGTMAAAVAVFVSVAVGLTVAFIKDAFAGS